MDIDSHDALRARYADPKPLAVRKQLAALDPHCRQFIALSPFVVMSTADAAGRLDASPRGGAPGFVRVADDVTLLIPDAPGNNRLDSLSNIVETGGIGLLFLVPGFDETLRVNGRAAVSADPATLAACADDRRTPKTVIRVTVLEAYLHCAKSLMRSGLWDPARQVPRDRMPTIGQIIRDQTGGDFEPESQAQMLARYRQDL